MVKLLSVDEPPYTQHLKCCSLLLLIMTGTSPRVGGALVSFPDPHALRGFRHETRGASVWCLECDCVFLLLLERSSMVDICAVGVYECWLDCV